MTAIIKLTDLDCDVLGMFDEQVRQHHLLVSCATFEVGADRTISLASEQRPLLKQDVYHGEPGGSSVRFEADIALQKTQVDVLVDAKAHAPRGRPTERVIVGLRVGSVRKELIVHGDRTTGDRLSGYVRPFLEMPIIYERAHGGPRLPSNPVGIGHMGARSTNPDIQSTVPNIEDPRGRDIPAGFGPIARSWSPRRELAGTFDQHWQKLRAPRGRSVFS